MRLKFKIEQNFNDALQVLLYPISNVKFLHVRPAVGIYITGLVGAQLF